MPDADNSIFIDNDDSRNVPCLLTSGNANAAYSLDIEDGGELDITGSATQVTALSVLADVTVGGGLLFLDDSLLSASNLYVGETGNVGTVHAFNASIKIVDDVVIGDTAQGSMTVALGGELLARNIQVGSADGTVAGTLTIGGDSGSLAMAGGDVRPTFDLTLEKLGVLFINSTTAVEIDADITGSGKVELVSSPLVNFQGDNTYSGETTVATGCKLEGLQSPNSPFFVDGTLDLSGGAQTLFSLSGDGVVQDGFLTLDGASTTDFSGSIQGATTNLTINGGNSVQLSGANPVWRGDDDRRRHSRSRRWRVNRFAQSHRQRRDQFRGRPRLLSNRQFQLR